MINQYFRNKVNYTYLDNEGKPDGFDEYVALPLSPRDTVNYVATLTPTEHVTFDNTLKYVSPTYTGNNDTGTKVGDYLLWDMRLSYTHALSSEIYGGIDDVTNKRYEEAAGYPLPGRTIYGGLRLRLWG